MTRPCSALLALVTPLIVAAASPVLEPTTIADWRATGMDGTGCYWSRHGGGPILFAASGRKAVARINGRVLVFAPRRHARHLFPLTFNAWRWGDLTIRMTDTGVVGATGEESITIVAWLTVTRRRGTERLRGLLICGS